MRGDAVRMRRLLVLVILTLAAGCAEPYESGSETPIECEVTHNESELDDGAPNPLRCEREIESGSESGP